MTTISVSRLPKDPGPAAWNRILPPQAPPEPHSGRLSADWLVIGAGFAGLSAARRLSAALPGDKIAVLDATRVAEGPAGRNSGFMVDLPHDLSTENYGGALERDRETIQDNRTAIGFARSMAEEFGLSQEAFSQAGKINAAATGRGQDHNRSFAAHLDALGESWTMLDSGDMRERTGTGHYVGGLRTPGAAIIQPALYIRGIADGLRARGVTIRECSPVTALARDSGGNWTATVAEGRGTVTAPRAILAVNGHLESFGHARGRLMHLFTYGSMTRKLHPGEIRRLGGLPSWGVTPSDPMGSSVRRITGIGGDRILVRNRFTFEPSLEASDRRLAGVAHDHDRAFAARFPMLDGVEMEYRWGGRLCLSLNGVQVVREIEERLYAACCQNGIGTVRGTLAGLLAADLAMSRPSPALDRMLAADRPRRLPPEPLARIGAGIRLRWMERRAGKEL